VRRTPWRRIAPTYRIQAAFTAVVLVLGFALVEPLAGPVTASPDVAALSRNASANLPWGGSLFAQFHVGAQAMIRGLDPYDPLPGLGLDHHPGLLALTPGALPTNHPPTTLLLFVPLALLDLEGAAVLHAALSLLALALCCYLWGRMAFPDQRWIALVCVGACLLWPPVLRLLAVGQITAWTLLGLTGWAWAATSKRDVLGGLCLALLLVKPHVGLLPGCFAAATLLSMRRYRMLGVAAATGVAWVAVTTLIAPDAWASYLERVQTTPPHYLTATLASRAQMAFGPALRPAAIGLALLGTAAAAVAGWWAAGRPGLPVRAAIAGCASLCLLPHAFDYDMVLALPAGALALGALVARPRLVRLLPIVAWVAIGLTYLDRIGEDPGQWFMMWMVWLLLSLFAPLEGWNDSPEAPDE